MSTPKAKKCPGCKARPGAQAAFIGQVVIHCEHCHEGAPDSSPIARLIGAADNLHNAVLDWNAKVEMETE